MHLVFSVTAYPFGVLADHIDRRLQLGIGTIILVGADVVLANASTVWLTALGAALWGLQLGVTQGLLEATIADGGPIDCVAPPLGSMTLPSALGRLSRVPEPALFG